MEHFLLLTPANLTYMMSGVTEREKQIIRDMVERGGGDKTLPFPFMGWVECIAYTAYDWQFSDLLNNVFVEPDRDFSQYEQIMHTGALLIGTYDNFTYGDRRDFCGTSTIASRRTIRTSLSLLRVQDTPTR